jgi:transmembrane protein DUF3566
MKQRITRVDPLQVAKVLGVLYVVIGFIILVPVFLIVGKAVPQEAQDLGFGLGMGFTLVMPVIYGIFGFIFTLIGAALYNFVAGMVGGIEVELEGSPVA